MITITGESLGRRLKEINMQKQELADALNVSPTAVSNWLIRGVPSNKKVQVMDILKMEDFIDDEKNNCENLEGNNIEIPKLRNITVSAGIGFNIDSVDLDLYDGTLTLDTKDIMGNRSDLCSLVAIRVDGRSMSPTLNNDEWVIVNKAKRTYIGDNLYVVNYAGNLLVKRLQYDPSTNSIEIISDNPSYKNYKVNLNEDQQYFQIIGLVTKILTGC